jgi:hypothetical protein
MLKKLVPLTVVVAFAAISSTVAFADGGGATIAAAPELPIGTTIVGGSQRSQARFGEFWRVTLAAGDL